MGKRQDARDGITKALATLDYANTGSIFWAFEKCLLEALKLVSHVDYVGSITKEHVDLEEVPENEGVERRDSAPHA